MTIAGALHADYDDDDLSWSGSPFAWIKYRPSSKQRGTIGEQLIAGFFAAKDFDVVRAPDSEADRIINGVRAEIKFSTLWSAGSYKFQQLRDQRYGVGIWLGVSPFDAHCWVVPKSVIMHRWSTGDIKTQHAGRSGTDTAWLTVDPTSVPRWLSRLGGTLGHAVHVLRQLSPPP